MKENFMYDYEALDEQGYPYWRKARVVGELPHGAVDETLKIIAKLLGVEKINFGVPLYVTLGLTLKEAEARNHKYLLLKGEEIPISLLSRQESTEQIPL